MTKPESVSPAGPAEFVEIVDGDVTWRFDETFLRSKWTCIWGRGCQGIGDESAPELQLGCCSVGAELASEDEAMTIAALAATMPDGGWQYAGAAQGPHGVFSDGTRTNTLVVDGACIFLNRPGFAGGAGCALHLEALRCGESPIDWKPSVCWQLPIRVDWADLGGDHESATVRAWRRTDWGPEGETMAWCCTEEPETYVGDRTVVDSLGEELRALVGDAVYVEVRRRLG